MDSVPCEFVFRGVDAPRQRQLCSLLRSTNKSLDGLEARMKGLQTAIAAKRQVLQDNVDRATKIQDLQTAGTGNSDAVASAQAKLVNYDAQVKRLTDQLNAYKKLPTVLSSVNQQIDTLTQSLQSQATPSAAQMEVDEGMEVNEEVPPSIPVEPSQTTLPQPPTSATQKEVDEGMKVDEEFIPVEQSPGTLPQPTTPPTSVPLQSILKKQPRSVYTPIKSVTFNPEDSVQPFKVDQSSLKRPLLSTRKYATSQRTKKSQGLGSIPKTPSRRVSSL